jgi:hypothetical protein
MAIQAVLSYETSVNFYQSTIRYTSEDNPEAADCYVLFLRPFFPFVPTIPLSTLLSDALSVCPL